MINENQSGGFVKVRDGCGLQSLLKREPTPLNVPLRVIRKITPTK